jgi:ferritin
MINNLVDIAGAEHDHATHIFLQWFVTEQVEEEESAGGVLEQLRLVKDDKSGLFMIDRELLKRAAPSELAEME